MANLKEAEYLAETLMHKLEQLMKERAMMRKELARRSDSSLEQEKAFVGAFRDAILEGAVSSARVYRLEHMLMLRG